jgi:hypothetical protein
VLRRHLPARPEVADRPRADDAAVVTTREAGSYRLAPNDR